MEFMPRAMASKQREGITKGEVRVIKFCSSLQVLKCSSNFFRLQLLVATNQHENVAQYIVTLPIVTNYFIYNWQSILLPQSMGFMGFKCLRAWDLSSKTWGLRDFNPLPNSKPNLRIPPTRTYEIIMMPQSQNTVISAIVLFQVSQWQKQGHCLT